MFISVADKFFSQSHLLKIFSFFEHERAKDENC